MSPVVFVADEQDDQKVDTNRWMQLANDVLTAEKVGEEIEVSVVFVNEKSIADLNERFMGKTGVTDVLSFPIDEVQSPGGRQPDAGGNGPGGANDDDEAEPTALLGDVVICPAVAKRNAPKHAGKFEDEVALLLVHGLLHLLGMDHDNDEEARVMEQREKALLDEFHKELPSTIWSTMQDGDDSED